MKELALYYVNNPICLSCDVALVVPAGGSIYEPGEGCHCGGVTFWSKLKVRFRRDIFVTIMRFAVLVIRLQEDLEHVCMTKGEYKLVDPVMDCMAETYGRLALACTCKLCHKRVQSRGRYVDKYDIEGGER